MLMVRETFVNRTEGQNYGGYPPTEAWTDDVGKLYRTLQREYGRCDSKVYVDTDEGTKAVGWVFVSRQKYEDSDETYLREVWVTLYREYREETVVHAEYAEVGR